MSNLFQTIVIEGNSNSVDAEENNQPLLVKQTRTKNPFMVITKIELNKK